MNKKLGDLSSVSSMLQEENWKKIIAKFRGQLVLPLRIYVDDYEINNTLGSHRCIKKMTGVYYTMSCLPPEFCA